MFKPHYGYCTHPDHNHNGEESFIVVKIGWCDRCNHRVKNEKKKAAGKKVYTGISKLREPTGEKHLFETILDSYDDKSEVRCFVCQERITLITHSNFAHVLSKGSTPELRLDPENVKILCFKIDGTGCHNFWDTKAHSELKGEGWDRMKDLRDRLKVKANQIKSRQ